MNNDITNRQVWEAEEWYCVNEFLNKLSVPKEDENGNTYSTVGRIITLMKMSENQSYREQPLSNSDFVESILNKIR